MKFKYWKPIVFIISSVILFIEVVILIYDINDGKIEWGNVSDWLSSLSTFGTLLIAYAAYVKAPDWIKQRKHETAFDLAQKVMIHDILELSKLMNIVSLNSSNLEWKFDILSTDPKDFVTIQECEESLRILDDFFITPTTIDTDISKLKKLGWHIDENAKKDLQILSNKYYKTLLHYRALWNELNKYITHEQKYTPDRIQAMCLDRIKSINNTNETFNKTKESFENRFDTFDLYFTIKTK